MANISDTDIDLAILGTRDATIATAWVRIGDVQLTVDGTSKRDPHDDDDVEVAELLALGRALQNLSNKVLKRANGLIKHNDDIKAYREVQKAKSNAKKKVSKSKTLAKLSAKV